MPRNNLVLLVVVAVASLICHQQVKGHRYGRILVDVMDQISRRYIEPVPPEQLFQGAVGGMVNQLDDPYSAFIPPQDLGKLNEELDSEFGGVGMEVRIDPETNQLTVTCPLVGTPAHEKGILPGDRILRIDGRSTQGLSLDDAVGLMRGKPGEPVVLTILREGAEEPVEIELVRARIRVDTVLGDRRLADGTWDFFLDGHEGVGYVRVNKFSTETAGELRAALERLVERGMKGLILDLRDDPGGLLRSAVDVCDLFIESGVIVTTRGRDAVVRDRYEARARDTFRGFPMAVIVNRHSASASEIVAACLQDHGRAVIVGERTWGKGTVQEVIDLLDDAGALRLTTAGYWRPSGRNIHRPAHGKGSAEADDWGVEPDEGYRVSVEGDALVAMRLFRQRRDIYRRPASDNNHGNGDGPEADGGRQLLEVDPQLAKAVEYVLEATQQTQ
jgi:carboxyl-terminal processing protease